MIFHGTVSKGKGTGAVFGFPTANIPLADPSVSGVYAAIVTVSRTDYSAAVYADQKRKLLEAHLLDFSGDLYDKEITVVLGQKIREDQDFSDVETLRKQIETDVATIRALPRTI
jgi:riboflavin kinase/FMN adenylyltransferase